jgi:2-iminobutanoate/2-iminopropanoate deaminase
MAEKNSIWAEKVAAPEGHYPQALKYDEEVFISGILPVDAEGALAGKDAEAQSRQILNNLTEIMQTSGGQMSNVLRTTLYVTDLAHEAAYDKVCRDFFFFQPPVRTVVQVVGLPKGALICVDAEARVSPPDAISKAMI